MKRKVLAQSGDMSTDGARVKARRVALGMTQTALGKAAGVDRDTIGNLENNKGFQATTLHKVNAALDELEVEAHGEVPAASTGGLIEFEVAGDFGVRVVVRGPVADADALGQAVAKLVRDIRNQPSTAPLTGTSEGVESASFVQNVDESDTPA